MNICPYCQRTVPGVETICKDCYERLYANTALPKPTLIQLIKNWSSRPIPDAEPAPTVSIPIIGWLLALLAGLVLYFFLTFAPIALAGPVLLVANGIIAYDICDSSIRQSRRSIFSVIVLLGSGGFYILERVTGNQTYGLIGAAGGCLMAAYILIEHRRVI